MLLLLLLSSSSLGVDFVIVRSEVAVVGVAAVDLVGGSGDVVVIHAGSPVTQSSEHLVAYPLRTPAHRALTSPRPPQGEQCMTVTCGFIFGVLTTYDQTPAEARNPRLKDGLLHMLLSLGPELMERADYQVQRRVVSVLRL